jgi:hypothetical protein
VAGVGTRHWGVRVPRPVWEELVGTGILAKLVNDRIKLAMADRGYRKLRMGKRQFWFSEADIAEAERGVTGP